MDNKTYDEALRESREYFRGDELAASVWINKYAMKDSFGNLYETSPDQMHWRLANEFARIEQQYPNPMTAARFTSCSGISSTSSLREARWRASATTTR